jgi:hypothetical protein
MISYVSKRNKAIILLSTMHHDAKVDRDTGDKQTPEMITFYSLTKTGVDVVDQLCTCLIQVQKKNKTLAIGFFLSFAGHCSFQCLVLFNYSQTKDCKTTMRLFVKQLAIEDSNLHTHRRENLKSYNWR